MKKNKQGRYTHCISLNEDDERKLQSVRSTTGHSIVKLLMAIVVPLSTENKE